MKNNYFKLCLVSNLHSQTLTEYQSFLTKALRGGITSVQLREKSHDPHDIFLQAMAFKKILAPYQVPLIINDHVDIAIAVNAEGVHLGQTDLSPEKARELLGPDKIIGLSIETLDELERANQLECIDYVAASAIFPSKTKPDCKTLWGLDGLQQVTRRSRHPVMAIGGITHKNINAVMQTGACGAAVIGAIHDAPNPARATRDLLELMLQAEQDKEPARGCHYQ